MLRSLLSAHGVNPQMITVFIDGYYEVPGFCFSDLSSSVDLYSSNSVTLAVNPQYFVKDGQKSTEFLPREDLVIFCYPARLYSVLNISTCEIIDLIYMALWIPLSIYTEI